MAPPLFSIIGDGNVRRNMTGLNIASRESMKAAQVIDYAAPGSFDDAFKEIRPESTVCIIAALTDLLLSGGGGGTVFASIGRGPRSPSIVAGLRRVPRAHLVLVPDPTHLTEAERRRSATRRVASADFS